MGLVMPKSASLTVRDELTRQFLGWEVVVEIGAHLNLPPKKYTLVGRSCKTLPHLQATSRWTYLSSAR